MKHHQGPLLFTLSCTFIAPTKPTNTSRPHHRPCGIRLVRGRRRRRRRGSNSNSRIFSRLNLGFQPEGCLNPSSRVSMCPSLRQVSLLILLMSILLLSRVVHILMLCLPTPYTAGTFPAA